jgi:hypothetical protein
MSPLVELISQEMARSFSESGITMPPWRASKAIMSKWAPQRAVDKLPSEAASPRAGSLTALAELEKPVHLSQKIDSSSRKGTVIDRCGMVDTGAGTCQRQCDARRPAEHGIGLPGQIAAVERPASVLVAQPRHLRRSSRSSSPVLSVKVGFEFPGQQAEK